MFKDTLPCSNQNINCIEMKKIFSSRFSSVYALYLIFISVSFVTRLILFTYSFSQFSKSIWEIGKSICTGLFFDTIAFGYFMIPFVLVTLLVPHKLAKLKLTKYITYTFYTLATVIIVYTAFAEYFFWDEFNVKFNFIAVDYLIYTTEVVGNIWESYNIPLLVISIMILTGAIVWLLSRKGWIGTALQSAEGFVARLKTAAILLIVPAFGLIFVTHRYSEISENTYNKELSKNGVYSFFEAFKNNKLDYEQFYLITDKKEAFTHLRQLMADTTSRYISTDVMNPIREIKATGEEKQYNIFLITVESLSGEYMSYIQSSRDISMPFMDSLANQSLFFTNLYATGTRTVRGLEAINLSIPPTPGTSIVRRPGNEDQFSMGSVFKEKGYINKYIYGGYGYFDNMNQFFSSNGFEIVDRNDIKPEEITFANVWGVCDQDIYNRAIKEADSSFAKGKPFLNFVMTTSNHRPYTFPNVGIDFPKTRKGGVMYTDYALKQLFKAVKDKPWFNNTIFIVVADHCGGSAGRAELPIREYQIPLVIYSPANIPAQKVDKLCSQIDLLPTLLGVMNWSYKSTFYGKDVMKMRPDEERAFIGNYQKLGYIKNDKLSILSPQQRFTFYQFDRITGEENSADADETLKSEAVTYYQTAEYMFVNGLNKVNKK